MNKKWGIGPEIFTPESTRIYGEFLGKRYRSKPIIWISGGTVLSRTLRTLLSGVQWRRDCAMVTVANT